MCSHLFLFCLDTLHGCSDTLRGCSNTLHGCSDRLKVDFSMFSHLYPESYTPFSSPHSSLSFLLLSTDSVTKKTTVVRAVFFLYNSGSIFATKNFVTESVLKVRSFMSVSSGKMLVGNYCIAFCVTMKNSTYRP